nr:hypothetical protein [uncultured Vibrio sp.]
MGAHKQLKASFALPEDNYPQTELVGALFDISSDLIAKSKANRKIVLVVSDMLENSKQLTFYKRGQVSVPSAEKALTKIESLDAKGNFDNADIHVIGAGYLNGGKNYTNHNSMTQLERFWTQILNNANGNVKQFGKPNLLVSVN